MANEPKPMNPRAKYETDTEHFKDMRLYSNTGQLLGNYNASFLFPSDIQTSQN